MGEKRANEDSIEEIELEDLPSDINEDPWGQIAEHQDH
jgi:hypothetical protein